LVVQDSLVFFVRADPTPQDSLFELLAKRSIVSPDPNGPINTGFLEVKRGMTRIGIQQVEVLSRELLNLRRKRVEEPPEIRAREVLQISRLLPDR